MELPDNFYENFDDSIDKLKELLEYTEITLVIYRLSRMVIGQIVPDELQNYPKFGYTHDQEQSLLKRLAELQGSENEEIAMVYQMV